MPKTAMILAAGRGSRLRPLTDNLPKPLVKVAGRTLLERGLDLLEQAGVEKTIINSHYLAAKLNAYIDKIRKNYAMRLLISDESDKLLDSAGGIIKALPLLGQEPFFVLNADTFWQEPPGAAHFSNLRNLAAHFDPDSQDMLLLTVARAAALIPPPKGDFIRQQEAVSAERANREEKKSEADLSDGESAERVNRVLARGARSVQKKKSKADLSDGEAAEQQNETLCRLARASKMEQEARKAEGLTGKQRNEAVLAERQNREKNNAAGKAEGLTGKQNNEAVIYAGALLLDPKIFTAAPKAAPLSLNLYFDRAIGRRRLYGLGLKGKWLSVGSPQELAAAEAALRAENAESPPKP